MMTAVNIESPVTSMPFLIVFGAGELDRVTSVCAEVLILTVAVYVSVACGLKASHVHRVTLLYIAGDFLS